MLFIRWNLPPSKTSNWEVVRKKDGQPVHQWSCTYYGMMDLECTPFLSADSMPIDSPALDKKFVLLQNHSIHGFSFHFIS